MLRLLKRLVPQRNVLRLSWHRTKSFLAAMRYGFPARKLTVIGVTGTDGKTTTVGMTAHILEKSGIAVGAMSTAFFQVKDDISWNETQKTSPSPFVIQGFLRELVNAGCTHAILEYSSHGLVQGRTLWTWPAVSSYTNTSFEHLDYHGSMEQYRRDKSILFSMLRGKGTKVLHREDALFEICVTIPSDRTITYATHPLDQLPPSRIPNETLLWSTGESFTPSSSHSVIHCRETDAPSTAEVRRELTLRIPGAFNVENALCALGNAMAVGVSLEKGIEALSTFPGVPGRMEKIDGPQTFTVYVDFTVTPVAYEKTLSQLRTVLEPGKRLLVLTGSCGDRMREKRPEVGRICSTYADVVVVSNEDPYAEDPSRIIEEVWSGIDQTKTKAAKIADRLEAIQYLFAEAKEGDIVLLCGKGSDTTMWTKKGQIPWNEREIAHELLKSTSRM
jgi:UDP-N-acetylmuramoyl-L-alanyl-D-glutamate--2,6-diaminopimelate ligase